MDRPWVLFSSCCWCVAVIVIIIGAVMLNEELDKNEEHQPTICAIEAVYPTECAYYECDCYKQYNKLRTIMEQICQPCKSATYKYAASATICIKTNSISTEQNEKQEGQKQSRMLLDETNKVLLSQYGNDNSDGECGTQIKKDIGEQYECYVNCEDKMFTFEDPTVSITTSIILLAIGGIICLCGGIPPFIVK
eukprot:152315_1